jgi:hypothetical protein
MVLAIDQENPGTLRIADREYDKRVAGVVSGAGGIGPGVVMAKDGSVAGGTWPVAMSGRVYCMTDAGAGAVEPGDFLTTSSIPGYAMKAIDPSRTSGAVLGKAMSSLKSGKGLVLILVSLQ